MSEERSDLNLSARTFEKIAKSSAVYVDKTGHLADLVGGPARVWFLSRPGRFGKSLTVSTLKALFSGRRELFEGLAVERRLDDKAFAPARSSGWT